MVITELKALAKKLKITLPATAKKSDMVDALVSVARKSTASPKTAVKKTTVAKAIAKKTKPAKKTTIAKKASAIKKAATKIKAVVAEKVSLTRKTAAPKKIARTVKTPVAGKTAAKKTAPEKKAPPVKVVAPEPRVNVLPKRTPVRSAGKPGGTPAPEHEWKMPPGVEEPLMAQEKVAEAKYYTGPGAASANDATGTLPREYGVDKVVLMARDPDVAYAYWEVTPERLEREKSWLGMDSKLFVRIYDVTGVQFDGRNAGGYFDQEVYERVGSWYFDMGRPSHSFCADLGLLSPTGKFLTLARSNYVIMPRDTVSDVIDEEWMLVDEAFWKLYGFPGNVAGNLSSQGLREMGEHRRREDITSPGRGREEVTSPGVVSRGKAKRR